MRPLVVVLLLLLPLALGGGAAAANAPPEVGPIVAELSPPRTLYVVEASDPDGDVLTYRWEWEIGCGEFSFSNERAVWSHPHPPCGDEPFHPGTIRVHVSDGLGEAVVRTYTNGSQGGAGDDPRDEPPPVIFGEEIRCDENAAEGRFAPTQGVWQDDDLFADSSGKQLRYDEARERWIAELALVKEKPTLLVGTRGDRDTIVHNVTLAGTKLGEARVRFTLTEQATGETRVVARSGWRMLNIYGECGEAVTTPWEIEAPRGLPADTPPFVLRGAGRYDIVAELEDRRGALVPNTQVHLTGESVEIPPFTIRLVGYSFAPEMRFPRDRGVPLVVGPVPPPDAMDGVLASLKTQVESQVPNYFPVPPGAIRVVTDRETRALVPFEDLDKECRERPFPGSPTPAEGYTDCFASKVVWHLYSEEVLAGWFANARAGIGVLDPTSFYLQHPAASGGHTVLDKVAFVRAPSHHWTVAHEFSHLEGILRGSPECGVEYHGEVGKAPEPWGNGFRIHHGSDEVRTSLERVEGIMMGDYSSATVRLDAINRTIEAEATWIEQCTYYRLLQTLREPRDPMLQALVFQLVREDGKERVELASGHTMMGVPDLLPGSPGSHAIVFRDAAGAELARYGFDAPTQGYHGPILALPVALRVERPEGAATLAIEGPDGALLTRALSATPVAVSLDLPRAGAHEALPNGSVELSWHVSGGAGGPYVSRIFVSSDDGVTWRPLGTSTNATRAFIDASRFADGTHALRVVASDGMQSGEATVEHVVEPIASVTPSAVTGATPSGEPARAPGPGLAALVAALALVTALRRRGPR